MKVLFLTQVLPYPPDSGGKIKSFNLIRYLAQGHEVILASLVRSVEDRKHLIHLQPYCRRIETVVLKRSRFRDARALCASWFTGRPFLIQRDMLPEMQTAVKQLVDEERPDVVHVVQLNMAPYGLGIAGVSRVLDQENAVSTILERMYGVEKPGPRKFLAYWEWKRLARYEGQVCRQFDQVLAVSEEDKRVLGRLAGGQGNMTVIPIGIDCQASPVIPRRADARGILSLGTMFYPPNVDGVVWFAREVFPSVQQQIPGASFFIAGKDPPGQIRKLEDGYPPSNAGHRPIVVAGYVQDPTPFFAGSAVFVVPLRVGGGMRVKILDAWSRGMPIVSTTVGAEGIEIQPGDNILIADTPQDFAAAVVRVMQDRDLARRLAENGRRWVEDRYDWRVAYRAFDRIYRRPGEGSGAPGPRSVGQAG